MKQYDTLRITLKNGLTAYAEGGRPAAEARDDGQSTVCARGETTAVGQSATAMGQSSTAIGPETIAADSWQTMCVGPGPRHAEGGCAPGERCPHLEGTPLDPERFHGHAVGWAPDWHYQHMEGTSVDPERFHGHAVGWAPDWHYQHMEGTSVDSKSCHGRAEGVPCYRHIESGDVVIHGSYEPCPAGSRCDISSRCPYSGRSHTEGGAPTERIL